METDKRYGITSEQVTEAIRQAQWGGMEETIRELRAKVQEQAALLNHYVALEAEHFGCASQAAEIEEALGEYYTEGFGHVNAIKNLVSGYKDQNQSAATFMRELNECEKQLAAAQAHIAVLREALRELVACKNLKSQVEAIRFSGVNSSHGVNWESTASALESNYNLRKPDAWVAACEAISIESPTDALREHDARLVERIAEAFTSSPAADYLLDVADKIRHGEYDGQS
jgi:chromosome segregation ATPase